MPENGSSCGSEDRVAECAAELADSLIVFRFLRDLSAHGLRGGAR